MNKSATAGNGAGKRVFVPMSDEILNGEMAMSGELVPFDPSYLVASVAAKEDRKPANWITTSNFDDALERLHANRDA